MNETEEDAQGHTCFPKMPNANRLDEVQKLTNTYIGKIDELSKSKEHGITSV